MLGTAHFALATVSLALGAAMLLQQKGGRRHRLFGYLYAAAMILVNSSALLVHEESQGMGPFHILALVSLATLMAGFVPAFLRWPAESWLQTHAYFMSWSYVGLVAAGVAQMATKLIGPGASPVVITAVLVVVVGAVWIHSRVPEILSGIAHGKT